MLLFNHKSLIISLTVQRIDLNKINIESEFKLDEKSCILDDCVHKINTRYLSNDLFYSNPTF